MIVRIGKCKLTEEEVSTMSLEQYREMLPSCKPTVNDLVTNKLEETEWYGRTNDFNLITNTEATKNLCGDNVFCLLDSFNRTLMETTKFTHEVYNFITWHAWKMKDGFLNEIEQVESALNLIFFGL